MAARTPRSSAPQEPVSSPKPATNRATPVVTEAAPSAALEPTPSVLGRLRRNRMGGVLGGLLVALGLGMLLSIFVPDSNVLLALAVLGLAESLAVGFTVRYLTECRGWPTQLTAFVLAAIGVHVMITTGIINQSIGSVTSALGGLLSQSRAMGSGLGWDDALIGAFATPAVSTGTVVCGLIAAIVAGWGVSGAYHHRDAV